MKKLTLISLIATILSGCNHGEKLPPSGPLIRELNVDMNTLLPVGKYEARIQGIKHSPKLNDLQQRFKQAIQTNYEWFQDYAAKNRNPGEALPYHKNLGLSESEFNEMNKLLNEIRYETIDKESINIKKSENGIILSGSGELRVYGDIQINVDSNYVMLGELTCPKSEFLEIKDSENGFGSSWDGYQWKDETVNSLDDIRNLIARQVKFTLGRLSSTGERYLGFQVREFNDGEEIVNTMTTVLM